MSYAFSGIVTLFFLLLRGLFGTAFEFATVIASALFGALVNDVVPHEFLGRFYELFRVTSLLTGILFNYFLLGFAATHYEWLFVGIGVLCALGFTVMCLQVKEGDYPPAESTIMSLRKNKVHQ